MNEAGINNLRLAILERARTDYIDILQGIKKDDNLCNKKELEKFFNSEYFNTLYFDIGYSGKDIINIIRKEVENEKHIENDNRRIKSIY